MGEAASEAPAAADAATDIGVLWTAALMRYEEITTVKLDSLDGVNSIDGILNEISSRETKFKTFRHSGSKIERFRSTVKNGLAPIEKLGSIAASAASTVRQLYYGLIE